jgi:hypothetical protein
MESMIRTPAVGGWTILLAPGFKTVLNGDGWQAYADGRVIYVGVLGVKDSSGRPPPAEELRTTAARKFAGAREPRLVHESAGVCGEAIVAEEGGAFQLKGFMCSAGTIATCIIDFQNESDKEWAIASWKSLEHA